MEIITEPHRAAEWSAGCRRQGATVGFVPTMGALHEGHLDLVTRALRECDQVVCSVFVNPLQFNNAEDLAHYPRQVEQDTALLVQAGCHALFTPAKEAIFAEFTPAEYDLGGLDRYWEGPSRPGHFQGVVNVVERLFHYVRPDKAFFGEKDRQQLAILQYVARTLRWPEHIVPCPTVRAADGLALSSRNQRLSATERTTATALYKALCAMAEVAFTASPEQTVAAGMAVLSAHPDVVLDYLAVADARTLAPLSQWPADGPAVALVAAQVGPVRLIDNMTLERAGRGVEGRGGAAA